MLNTSLANLRDSDVAKSSLPLETAKIKELGF